MDKLGELARRKKLAMEMTHVTRPDIESLRGQDPLTDWGLGVRERTLNPLAALAKESKRFQGLTPEEMGMEMVGGGMAGTFIGKNAKTWKAAMKDFAEKLEKEGVAPEEIWKQTGTFRGADKEWRQEIPDDKSLGKFTHLFPNKERISEQAVIHPELYSAYPSLNKGSQFGLREAKSGSYSPRDDMVIAKGMNEDDIRNVGLHELQHAIQQREGWAKGGSPNDMTEEALDMLRRDVESGQISSNKQAIEMLPMAQMNAYKRLAGEAEARLTQARMNMTSEQRLHSYPPSMFDVPMENQIVRRGYNGNSMNVPDKTQYELAHELAQKNASLPIEQGGLGLPASNTAMDRAKAMGFDTPAYHGTNADIKEFNLNRSGEASGQEQYGAGFYTTTNPRSASGYANPTKEGGNVIPLMVNMQKPLDSDTQKKLSSSQIKSIIQKSPELRDSLYNFGDIEYEGLDKVLNQAVRQNADYQSDNLLENLHPIANDFYSSSPQEFNNAVSKVLNKDGVLVKHRNGEEFLIPWKPEQLRSRFAAFDPFNRNSANILAGTALGAVGLSSLAGNQDEYY